MDSLNICFSADNNYARHLGTSITSILCNGDADNTYKFHILDGGIEEENKQKLLELKKIKDFDIEFYKINPDEFDGCPLNRFYISLAAFYRFKIPALLPENIDRALYLDCDTVVMKDLKEMFYSDLNGYMAAVIEDEGSIHQSERMKFPESHIYFNSGILLLNLEELRKFDFEKECFKYLEENRAIIRLQDQDILNGVFLGKCKYLHLRWNANGRIYIENNLRNNYTEQEILEATTEPGILHYTDVHKPWVDACKHPLRCEYLKFLAMTPWAGTPSIPELPR